MSYLSHGRGHDGEVSWEEISFFGDGLDATDAEMRHWLVRNLPLGSCTMHAEVTHVTHGPQHMIRLRYTVWQKAMDRLEPTGIFGDHS